MRYVKSNQTHVVVDGRKHDLLSPVQVEVNDNNYWLINNSFLYKGAPVDFVEDGEIVEPIEVFEDYVTLTDNYILGDTFLYHIDTRVRTPLPIKIDVDNSLLEDGHIFDDHTIYSPNWGCATLEKRLLNVAVNGYYQDINGNIFYQGRYVTGSREAMLVTSAYEFLILLDAKKRYIYYRNAKIATISKKMDFAILGPGEFSIDGIAYTPVSWLLRDCNIYGIRTDLPIPAMLDWAKKNRRRDVTRILRPIQKMMDENS